MKRFQKILVPLQFVESDRAVITMVSHLARWSEPSSITFCHFSPKVDIPESLMESHPWLLEPIDEKARERMEKAVLETGLFPDPSIIDFHVEEANPVSRSLELVIEKDCDLLVTGSERSDIAVRLARKAPCSVCVVPAAIPEEIRTTMVATDFSEYSRQAFEIGSALSRVIGSGGPKLVYVSQIHKGHRWGILPKDEIVKANEKYARSKMAEFCESLDPPPAEEQRVIHHHESVPFGVLDYVNQNGIDCIVAGCRGRDALSAVLLGSVVEQILESSTVPVLAVKAKGTGRGFLESILGIGE
ncbi:universal stress protein [Haloferula rosea]|uniref:Universal stress protein n=1 Tax=Haloferula rosea TaxID=490093 RepID=A0A934RDP0_9BACT|nr:universal stress protein [Haloferula rosea]MBK1826515.1 universal stress protein [Haloferula rosea]